MATVLNVYMIKDVIIYMEVRRMSTRCSLKYERDEAAGQEIHL